MKSLTLNLDKDLKFIATFDDHGYTKLNEVQLEAGWRVPPAKWIRGNISWLKKLMPANIYPKPYYTFRMGKKKGTYGLDKLLLAYVADNDNHWKQSLVELLYTNVYSGDVHRGTYHTDNMAISSEALDNLKQSEERFNYTISATNPDIAMKLKIDFIKWITGDLDPVEGENKILNGVVPGVSVYSSLLNRSSIYYTLTPTYEGITRLLIMGV